MLWTTRSLLGGVAGGTSGEGERETEIDIPGWLNTLADTLSCSKVDKFQELAPWVNLNPEEMPQCVSTTYLGTF